MNGVTLVRRYTGVCALGIYGASPSVWARVGESIQPSMLYKHGPVPSVYRDLDRLDQCESSDIQHELSRRSLHHMVETQETRRSRHRPVLVEKCGRRTPERHLPFASSLIVSGHHVGQGTDLIRGISCRWAYGSVALRPRNYCSNIVNVDGALSSRFRKKAIALLCEVLFAGHWMRNLRISRG